MIDLFPYQEEGVRFLRARKAALLADVPGLGKGIQAAAASAHDRDVLYLCPASLCEDVRRKYEYFDRKMHVVRGGRTDISKHAGLIMSYDTARRDALASQIMARRWDILICDESHYLKSPASLRAKKVLGNAKEPGFASMAERVWLMTGTPVLSHVGELWTALQAVRPDLVDGMSYQKFVQHYCVTKRHPRYGLRVLFHKQGPVKSLRARLDEDFMLRRLKRDVLSELPPMRVEPLYVQATIQDVDEDAVMDAVEEGAEKAISTVRHDTELAKVNVVSDIVREEFDAGEIKKLIIFAHHHDTIDALKDRLKKYRAAVLHGGLTPEKKQEAVDAFTSGRCQILIAQTIAGGVGFTLHCDGACTDVLFMSLDFTPANNKQAMMRIHRIGQPNACLARYAVASGTIDERVNYVLAQKLKRIMDVMEEE